MISIKNLHFSYGKKTVFENFSMELADGEILAVMGPSGCGKTTLLRLLAGLERPNEPDAIRSAHKKLSYVFQEPRLFPWMTIRANLRTVLPDGTAQAGEIDELLKRLGLEGTAELYPDELSGGMKSRVALARAMLHGGDLYLLDEPFAALDETLRQSLTPLLREHIKQRGASAILVTHQESDAIAIADRILYL